MKKRPTWKPTDTIETLTDLAARCERLAAITAILARMDKQTRERNLYESRYDRGRKNNLLREAKHINAQISAWQTKETN